MSQRLLLCNQIEFIIECVLTWGSCDKLHNVFPSHGGLNKKNEKKKKNFQKDFFCRKLCSCFEILLKFVIIGSGNGLVHQAITWANDDTVHWLIYASSGLVVIDVDSDMKCMVFCKKLRIRMSECLWVKLASCTEKTWYREISFWGWNNHIDGLVQDCSNSSALAMELLQSCTKPLICQ